MWPTHKTLRHNADASSWGYAPLRRRSPRMAAGASTRLPGWLPGGTGRTDDVRCVYPVAGLNSTPALDAVALAAALPRQMNTNGDRA